ncbi:hypothetical protein BH09VER1_BH09VER1_27090 [soil metagenome]
MANSEPAPNPPTPVPVPFNRPWLSLLLSVLLPGFGLLRAGRVARGFTWFICLQGLATFIAMLATWRAIPGWVVLGALGLNLVCFAAMLVDSYRPGHLTSAGGFIFIVLFLAFIFLPSSYQFAGGFIKIPSAAMAPTLQNSDWVLVDRLSYALSTPKRGDLAAIRTTGLSRLEPGQIFIKRVVGLPGEKIEIRDSHIYADGRLLGEKDGIPNIDYSLASPYPLLAPNGVYEVPPRGYLVLGDNPASSRDSRSWGSVPIENIYGRVARIYYPFDRLGVPK